MPSVWPPQKAPAPLAVLVSGGLDSAILLAEATKAYSPVYPVYVRVGSIWESVEYEFLTESLKDVRSRPEGAWQALAGSSATHVIVHERSYLEEGGPRLSDWLRTRGAQEVASFGPDRVFALRP